MARRANDFYPTPEWATEELLRHVLIGGNILECCCGDGAISQVLPKSRLPGTVFRNDIDIARPADWHEDASLAATWNRMPEFAWVVTNPPFNQAAKIVPLAYESARDGIAMLLRLSYLEPVEDRGAWLNSHPPTTLIVLPRISFTNDGKTDSVTCAWMVWRKNTLNDYPQRIIVAENPRFTKPVASAVSGHPDVTQLTLASA